MQEALIEALRTWPRQPPRIPKAWLVTVAWRRFLDAVRAEDSRRQRELRVHTEPAGGPAGITDDTLQLYFLCAYPSLSPSSAVALTLRAVGGLTTRQIAVAYLVGEATMAQRISRAKRLLAGHRFEAPGDVATVLRVLYLVFNEGYSGDVDLAAELIRLTRQLTAGGDHPEVQGLLALLLHHARRAARTGINGQLIPLAEHDRSQWDTRLTAEGWTSCSGRWPGTGSVSSRRRRPLPRCTPTPRRPARRVVRRAGAPHRQSGGRSEPGGRGGLPDRARRRSSGCGAAVRRGGPYRHQCAGAGPSDTAGGSAECCAARLKGQVVQVGAARFGLKRCGLATPAPEGLPGSRHGVPCPGSTQTASTPASPPSDSEPGPRGGTVPTAGRSARSARAA
ncbi:MULTISPECIES: DUF6596 domain-containing protein [unclassified Arthrobacter]|uniref:DUF6596 domain-containing protein n=1 Tax=unclassified Arthrobacter TaxID=235627 RepID=UPI00215797B9|nr:MULTISPECIES: DUF6596 domain-containing protein [unclassified Arthrobacter]